MTYWKAKLLPKIKKYFSKGPKKGVVEAAQSFDKSKESIENEIKEKKGELEPKVVEIYKDSKPGTKMLLKELSEEKVKQQGQAVLDLLQRLVEIGCPGAQVLKEAGDKYGVASMSVQIHYLFLNISPFLVNEEAPQLQVNDKDTHEEEGNKQAPAIVDSISREVVIEKSSTDEDTVEEMDKTADEKKQTAVVEETVVTEEKGKEKETSTALAS